jgi:hypothetical protein
MGFDEPMTRDPLFWVGLVVGAISSLIGVIVRDLSFGFGVWSVLCGTFTFTWLWAGGIGVLIRGYFRRRRDRNADLRLILSDVPVKEVE